MSLIRWLMKTVHHFMRLWSLGKLVLQKQVLLQNLNLRLLFWLLQIQNMGVPQESEDKIVDKEFLRKYIAYSRTHSHPILTQPALEKIKDFYVSLRRKGQDTGSVAITPRYLEGLVRLAEANSKTRLSSTVDETDADLAISLMEYVMKQVMIDRATGVFDVDTVATGKPKSERDKLEKIDTIL